MPDHNPFGHRGPYTSLFMPETESGPQDRMLNGAVVRVGGGFLLGIGVSPVAAGAITYPIGIVLGAEFAFVFRGAVYLLSAVLGLVVLHAIRLFYQGSWRSLTVETER